MNEATKNNERSDRMSALLVDLSIVNQSMRRIAEELADSRLAAVILTAELERLNEAKCALQRKIDGVLW
jgi:hypothetical protein